jgi:hypothetical protein
MTDEFVILSQRDLGELMTFTDYVETVTEGFQLLAQGSCESPSSDRDCGPIRHLPRQGRRSAPRARLHGG